jgi:hypothetical protein
MIGNSLPALWFKFQPIGKEGRQVPEFQLVMKAAGAVRLNSTRRLSMWTRTAAVALV